MNFINKILPPARRSDACFTVFIVLMGLRWLLFIIPAVQQLPSKYTTVVRMVVGAYMLVILYIAGCVYKASRAGSMQKTGLYRFFAHPAYTLYVVTDGVFLVALWPDIWNTVTSFAFIALAVVTAYYEEKHLIHRFGQEAEEYYSKTISVCRALGCLRFR